MHTSSYTKAQKKQLYELVDKLYERELNQHLRQLAEKVKAWENQEIDPWQLTDFIHQFYRGPNRELYNFYTNSREPLWAIKAALNKGLMDKSEVPEFAKEIC